MDKAHATWSASATARNVHCPGALALSASAPEGRETIHSATGTAVHWIAEQCLRSGVDPEIFKGDKVKTKEREIEIGDDEVNSAEMYVEYVRGRAYRSEGEPLLQDDKLVQIEQKFSLADLNPPFDAGGTGDTVLYMPEARRLEIVDLKNGMGVVDAKENPQLRTYALGAMLANPDLDVDTITVTIVQPRAAHKEGRIRSETFAVAELIEWTAELMASMRKSKQAMDELAAIGTNTVLMDEWVAKWLKPGKCTFCPVEGSCPALKRDALSVAKLWLDDMDVPHIGNSALDTSPEAVNRDLNMIPLLETWIKARRAFAHDLAEKGVEFADHVLAETFGHRKWAADETKVIADLKTVCGLAEDKIFDRKLKSPAAIEKVLGKKKDLTKNMWLKPVTGKALTARATATGPAAKSNAELFLEKE